MDIARDYAAKASRVDPLNDLGHDLSGAIEIYGGNFKAAISSYNRAIEINPAPMHFLFLSVAQYYAGDLDGSISSMKLFGKEPGMPNSMYKMWVSAINHNEKEFLKYSIQVIKYAIHDGAVSWIMADCFSIMGKTDEALSWIENAINLGFFSHIFYSEIDPNLNAVRQDPRFNALMEKAKNKEENFKRELGY